MKTITLSYFIHIFVVASVVTGTVYYLLVRDNFLHLSISSIIDYSGNLDIQAHLLILGLLPIYISMVIFGTTVLGYYVSNKINAFLKVKLSFLFV